jgi:hypothetical protein
MQYEQQTVAKNVGNVELKDPGGNRLVSGFAVLSTQVNFPPLFGPDVTVW